MCDLDNGDATSRIVTLGVVCDVLIDLMADPAHSDIACQLMTALQCVETDILQMMREEGTDACARSMILI